MADYKTIHGIKVKSYTTDPDNIIEGQVWYDKTNKVLQFETPNVTSTGAWRTAGTMNQDRRRISGAGIQTAALAISGTKDPPYYANVEQYDGASWTEIGDVNTAREEHASAGTVTAAITYGGNRNASPKVHGFVEVWNGSS